MLFSGVAWPQCPKLRLSRRLPGQWRVCCPTTRGEWIDEFLLGWILDFGERIHAQVRYWNAVEMPLHATHHLGAAAA